MSKKDADADDGRDLNAGDDAEHRVSASGSSQIFTEQAAASPGLGAEPEENVEDWGSAEDEEGSRGSDSKLAVYDKPYDFNKDQDLHLLAMKILGVVAVTGISLGSILSAMGRDLPDFIGVIVGSAVTAIAALFSKKS